MKKLAVTSLKVSDIMTTTMHTFTTQDTIRKAMNTLLQYGISGAPLVESGSNQLVSIVSELDLIKFAAMGTMTAPISSYLSKLPQGTDLVTVRAQDPFSEVYKQFLVHSYKRVPVVDDKGIVVGIVSRRDILKAFLNETD